MKIPENYTIPSLFMQNYFCLLNKQMAFVAISKNAVAFLKRIAVYTKTGKVLTSEDDVHNTVGFNENKGYLIPVLHMQTFEKKDGPVIKFAVWRDPVERLLSTYKFFCLEKEFRRYWQFLDLYNDNGFERFMEFVEFELGKTNVVYQDEHIRRQADYYNMDDVDYIVPIEKLNSFLREHSVLVFDQKSNATTTQFNLPHSGWIKRIKRLYWKDYDIRPNY